MQYRTEKTESFTAISEDGRRYTVHVLTEFLEDDDGYVTESARRWRTDAGEAVIRRPHGGFEVMKPNGAVLLQFARTLTQSTMRQ